MKRMIRQCLTGLLCSLAAGAISTQAAFQLVDNFQQLSAGPLSGQNGWDATLANVKSDPAQAGNKVASFEGEGPGGANRPLLIPNGTTSTLFFRAYSEADTTLVDWFAGMSDVAVTGLGAFPDFEVQIGYAGAQVLDTLRIRDGASGNQAAGEFLARTWYKIWAVIDNTADTTEVFIQGGNYAEQTQVAATATGNTSFVFRNSGSGPVANDLIRFFVKCGSAATPGPALLDDIYLATGRDLTDPVPNVNAPPVVSISSPAPGAEFVAPANITLTADASDPDGTVSKVEFFTGTTLIGTATSAPFSVTWNNPPSGFHNVTAQATDDDGSIVVSSKLLVTVKPAGDNNFVALDTFEAASAAALNGQNGWRATNATVIVDPTRSNNKVASFQGAGGAVLPAFLPEGKTGTLFFRVYSVSDTTAVDWFAGHSDVATAGPGQPYGDFEAQVGVAGAQGLDQLRVRDGGANTTANVEEFRPRTWYKIWLVINNEVDQYEVYMQGGQLAEPTLLKWDDFDFTSFVFRNSGIAPAANDLLNFLVLTTAANTGQFLLDDLYFDQFGKNLNDPVGTLTVLPTVAITAPATGTSYTAPANITVSAEASRTGGTIAKVEFFSGANLIGTATTAPYTITWSNVSAGSYTLTAKATDNLGGSQISEPISVTVNPAPVQGFQLVENFQQIPAGDLNGQNGWFAALAQVKADPTSAANKVASFEGAGAGGANLPVLIPNGSTGTLFFRIYSEADTTLVDWFGGMSDVAVNGLGAFGDFEVQIGYAGAQILDTLRIRNGAIGSNESIGTISPRTWYKVWAVINNATDTTEVFVQGGTYAEQTQLAGPGGTTSFTFRNSGAGPVANDLVRFFVRAGSAATPGPALLDDIYLATGKDLTDPSGGVTPTELRITQVQRDLVSGNLTLRWEGEGPLFQVEKAATVNGLFQAVGAPQSDRVFTDAGVLKNSAQGFYRVRQGDNFPTACTTATGGQGWVNTAFADQSGTFTAQFEATPKVAPIDSVIGLSSGAQTAFNAFGVLVRFNPSGVLDARNGGAYAAVTPITYSANVKYTFRVVVNVPAHTYSVYVTPEGGTEQTLATDYAFRTEQNTVPLLNHWGVIVASTAGEVQVCDFRLQ